MGWTDDLIAQLHEFYSEEEDYFTRLLTKLSQLQPTAAVDPGLIDGVIEKLAKIRSSAIG